MFLSVSVTMMTCTYKKKLGNMLNVEGNEERMKTERIIKELLNCFRDMLSKFSTTEITPKLRS